MEIAAEVWGEGIGVSEERRGMYEMEKAMNHCCR
jgi:hypothetical protein